MDKLFESFQERWRKKSEEFRQLELNRDACLSIFNGFLKEYSYLSAQIQKESVENFSLKREQLLNDLKAALIVAYHNHDKFLRMSSWWYRLVSSEKRLDLSMFKFPGL